MDDEVSIRALLRRWLVAAGYEVREADSAEAGLESLALAPADVVMCDVEMPGQGGLWMAEQIRSGFSHSAIVLATGVASVPAATSFKPGIVEYLVKPFDRAKVLAAVAVGMQWHETALSAPAVAPRTERDLEIWLDRPATGPK